MAKFLMTATVANSRVVTARVAAGTGSSNAFTDADVGKLVKYVGESRYDLCAAGNNIEGAVTSVESATLDNYSIGGVQTDGRLEVTFDGLQATPGTGTVAAGDYVVCGTVVARNTSLAGVPPKVCKSTVQLGAVPADLTAAGVMALASAYAWRVVSLGTAGTGAVGTVGTIERVGAAS